MDEEIARLRREIESLKQRVDSLERAMGEPETVLPIIPDAPPPPLPVQQAVSPTKEDPWRRLYSAAPAPAAPPPPVRPPAATLKMPARKSRASLESKIGQNWASWIGGIVFLLGVCFFLKYAWDQGWIRPTPAMRVVAAMMLGAIFCASGEWIYRKKIQGVLSATLYGSGFAIMMATLFGAHVFFDEPVISQPTAFFSVAVVAALGVLAALRINSVSLVTICLIGAYLSPAILSTGQDRSLELLSYLGVINAVGLLVSYFRSRWWGIRWFCWSVTLVWTITWLLGYGLRADHDVLGVSWMGVNFAMFLGQIVASLHKAIAADQDQLEPIQRRKQQEMEGNLSTLSLFNTAAAFAGIWVLLDPSRIFGGGLVHLHPIAAVALGLAAIQGMMIFTTPSKIFSIVSMLQAMSLVTIAVPLVLGEFAITISWLVMCAATAVTGGITRSKAMRGWAFVLLLLSVVRLFGFDSGNSTLNRTVIALGENVITRWTILAVGTAVLAHVIAYLNHLSVGEQRYLAADKAVQTTDLMALIGTAVFALACGRVTLDDGFTLVMIGWCAAMVPLVTRLVYYIPHAWTVAAMLGFKWLIVDELAPVSKDWVSSSPSQLLPVLNMPTLNGILLVILFLWLASRPTRRQFASPAARWTCVAVMLFAMLNFEICRAGDWLWRHYPSTFDNREILKQVSMSVSWGLIGFILVVTGFMRKVAALRWTGLVLLGLTLAKILLIDMAEVRAFYRILSFLVTGALLLGVSCAYHRHMAENEADVPPLPRGEGRGEGD